MNQRWAKRGINDKSRSIHNYSSCRWELRRRRSVHWYWLELINVEKRIYLVFGWLFDKVCRNAALSDAGSWLLNGEWQAVHWTISSFSSQFWPKAHFSLWIGEPETFLDQTLSVSINVYTEQPLHITRQARCESSGRRTLNNSSISSFRLPSKVQL